MKKLINTILCCLSIATINAQDIFLNSEHILTNSKITLTSSESVSGLEHRIADLDNDGHPDLIQKHRYALIWYRNDGSMNFDDERFIDSIYASKNNWCIKDLDDDGDDDIVTYQYEAIICYENDGQGNFAYKKLLDLEFSYITSIDVLDISNDAKLDIIIRHSEGIKISWFENIGSNQFVRKADIPTNTGSTDQIAVTDFDQDGDIDVLYTNWQNKLKILFNDGSGAFAVEKTLANLSSKPQLISCADIDLDGDIDVLITPETSKIILLEQSSDGTLVSEKLIADLESSIIDFKIIDLNNDHNLAIIAISRHPSLVSIITNVKASNPQVTILKEGNFFHDWKRLSVGDIDSDGDSDLLIGSEYHGILWFENTFPEFNLVPNKSLRHNHLNGLNDLLLADFDEDQDIDILTSSEMQGTISLFRNSFGGWAYLNSTVAAISKERGSYQAISYGDLNGNGHLDIVTLFEEQLIWYVNSGRGSFNQQQYLLATIPNCVDVQILDIDSDQDLDIVTIGNSGVITWFEKEIGDNFFNTGQTINTNIKNLGQIQFADLDNDGDLDIVASDSQTNEVVWLENEHGIGTFGLPQSIAIIENIHHIQTLDIDRDSDLDIIYASQTAGVSWIENEAGTFSITNEISSQGATTIHFADINDDTYPDLLSGTSDKRLVWHPFDPATYTFLPAQLINTQGLEIKRISTGDIDNDGDLDVVCIASEPSIYTGSSDKLAWYENKSILSANFDAEEFKLSWYPVPTTNFLTIEAEEIIKRVCILSLDGTEVMQQEIHKKTDQLQVTALNKGTYILKFSLQSGQEYQTLIVKE